MFFLRGISYLVVHSHDETVTLEQVLALSPFTKVPLSHWDLLRDELVGTEISLENDDKSRRWLRHIALYACFYDALQILSRLVLMMKLAPHRDFKASALEMAVSKCPLASVPFLLVFLPRLLTSTTADLLQVFICLMNLHPSYVCLP